MMNFKKINNDVYLIIIKNNENYKKIIYLRINTMSCIIICIIIILGRDLIQCGLQKLEKIWFSKKLKMDVELVIVIKNNEKNVFVIIRYNVMHHKN